MTADPRIAVLSALSSPKWSPVSESHGMPWNDAVQLLDAYRETVVAEVRSEQPPPVDRAAVLREAVGVADAVSARLLRDGRAPRSRGADEVADDLRRMADETPQPETVPERVSLTRTDLAGLLAHHADVLAARWRAVAPGAGAWEVAASLSLTSHANELTDDEEVPAVAELLDSIMTFRNEWPAAGAQPGKEAP